MLKIPNTLQLSKKSQKRKLVRGKLSIWPRFKKIREQLLVNRDSSTFEIHNTGPLMSLFKHVASRIWLIWRLWSLISAFTKTLNSDSMAEKCVIYAWIRKTAILWPSPILSCAVKTRWSMKTPQSSVSKQLAYMGRSYPCTWRARSRRNGGLNFRKAPRLCNLKDFGSRIISIGLKMTRFTSLTSKTRMGLRILLSRVGSYKQSKNLSHKK